MLLLVAWGLMVFTHEVGHLLGGYIGGAKIVGADLRPWRLPYSFHEPDPHPLLTLWCGPLFGVVAPAISLFVVRNQSTLFIASFCWLANGLYIGAGYFVNESQLDTPRLIAAGASTWSIGLYSCLTIGLGYWVFRKSVLTMFESSSPSAHPSQPMDDR